jgi:hypothetical protein
MSDLAGNIVRYFQIVKNIGEPEPHYYYADNNYNIRQLGYHFPLKGRVSPKHIVL